MWLRVRANIFREKHTDYGRIQSSSANYWCGDCRPAAPVAIYAYNMQAVGTTILHVLFTRKW